MADLTTDVLIDIRTELREMRGEIRGTNEQLGTRIDRTNERLGLLVEGQMRQGTALVTLEARVEHMENRLGNAFEGLNARIDNVLAGGMGEKVREHESRIKRVEEHLGLAGSSK